MRGLALTALTVTFAPVLLALPVVASAGTHAHPVAVSVRELPVGLSAVGSAQRGLQEAPLRAGSPAAVAPFAEVGAVWDAGTLTADQQLEVRTRSGGTWSSWQALEVSDAAADPGSRDDRAASSRHMQQTASPLWVGRSDAVQARIRAVGSSHAVAGAGTQDPAHLKLVLVDPGTSAADADPLGTATAASSASASEAQPAVYSRAQWGAAESLRATNGSSCTQPAYSSTVKVGFVHHTDGPNNYAPGDVPAILRGIYAYHVKTRGWCDIGYNFLVDRFGRVWEGRFGGRGRPVIGAHTGGFNANSFGTALIGTFSTATPSAAMLTGVEKLLAWKLGLHHRDPLGATTLTSAGGPSTTHAAGTVMRLHTISGHRDADPTACPGQAAYNRLGQVRSGVRTFMRATLIAPASSSATARFGGTGPTVTARVLQQQTWQLVMRRVCDHGVVRTWTGSTATSLSVKVDLHDRNGLPLRPGAYQLQLSSAAGTNKALPFTAPLTVTTTTPLPAAQSGTGTPAAPAGFVSVSPNRVLDTRTGTGRAGVTQPLGPNSRLDLQVTGVGGVPSAGVAAVAVNVTGVCAAAPTFVTVYPADGAQPATSTLNLAVGEVRATLALPRVSPAGKISVANRAGYTDITADVVGYYPTMGAAALYHPVTPRRLLDTRTAGSTRVAKDSAVTVPVAGLADVPTTATAVVVNVTAVQPSGAGFLTVSPSAATRSNTSTVNFRAGRVVPNRAVTGLSAGSLSVYAAGAATDVIVDLDGWYGPATTAGGQLYTASSPARILDTRTGVGAAKAPAGPSSTTVLTVAGRGGVPLDAKAVVVTLTATDVTAVGFITAWPGGPRPETSDLNLLPGATVANLAVIPLSSTGAVSLYNLAGRTDLIADVLGYYR